MKSMGGAAGVFGAIIYRIRLKGHPQLAKLRRAPRQLCVDQRETVGLEKLGSVGFEWWCWGWVVGEKLFLIVNKLCE
jgi:hypothetical protein